MSHSLAPLPTDHFDLIAQPHPLSMDTVYCQIPAGQTLQQALGDQITQAAKVTIAGREVPRQLWPHVRPKPGVPVHIVAYPQGDTGKKILRAILLIVVCIIAWYAAPILAGAMGFTAGTAAFGMAVAGISMAITMVGGMIVNALVPPPQPSMPRDANQDPTDRLNSLTGSQNRTNAGGAIPCVLGECEFYPPHAALPYTEVLANQHYMHMLLDCGVGSDLVVSDIKIGDTNIDDYEDVEYEVGPNPSLYSNDVFELGVGVPLSTDGQTATRTSQIGAEELSVDFVFPAGLFGVDKKGKTVGVSTDIDIDYRPVGSTGAWTRVQDTYIATPSKVRILNMRINGATLPLKVRSSERKPLRVGVAWKVEPGQYDVRCTRRATNWGNSENNAKIGDAQWGVLRTIRFVNPSRTGTTKIAVRIRATDQLNGVVSTLTCRVQQKIPVWDGTAWVLQTSVNPAYIYRWLLKDCPAVAKRVPITRIDDAFIKDFAAECTAKQFEVRGIADGVSTLQELLSQVLAAGRGSIGWRDGKYSVVWDKPQTVPRQHFTPLNSSGFSSTKMFTDQPHAFRVKFVNPDSGWQEDEIVVPFDGYAFDDGSGPKDAHGVAAPGLPLATKFEVLQFRFVTTPIHAWRLARFHQGQGIYRPASYSWSTDIEFLAVTRGDLVYVATDVHEWGDGWGRVKSQVLNGSNQVTSLTLDQAMPFEVGKSYSIRVRRNDGSSVVVAVTNPGAEASTFTVSTAGAGLTLVNAGDIVVLGETNQEMMPMLVTSIKPEGGLKASMSGVKYAPEIYTIDSSPPATFISGITGSPFIEAPPPPVLELSFSSNNTLPPSDDNGGGQPGISVSIGGRQSGSGFRNDNRLSEPRYNEF